MNEFPPADVARRPRRPSSLRAKWLLLLGALTILGVGAELALRAIGYQPRAATGLSTFFEYDPDLGWRGRPNLTMRFATASFDSRVTHDADGFRIVPPTSDPPPQETRRVWMLGDSMTWGWGVADDASIPAYILQMSKSQFLTRNLGAPGYATAQQILLLKKLLATEKPPDVLVLLFVPNDLLENIDGQDQDPARPYYEVNGEQVMLRNSPVPAPNWFRPRSWLLRHSRAYNMVNYLATRARGALRSRRMATTAAAPLDEAAWTAARFALAEFRDLAQSRQIPLVVAYMPGLAEIGEFDAPNLKAYEEDRRKRFLALGQELRLDIVDLAPTLIDHFRQSQERVSFPDDPHFNALGNRLSAGPIVRRLEERIRKGSGAP